MHWLMELSEKERLLRKDFENLSSIRRRRDLVSYDARELVVRRIKSRVQEIQLTIDSQLTQRDPSERTAISYQVDLKLPIYSHLNKLLSLLS
jgi:hypothetical protein